MKNFATALLIVLAGCNGLAPLGNRFPTGSGQREDSADGSDLSGLWKGYPFTGSRDSTITLCVFDRDTIPECYRIYENWEMKKAVPVSPSGLVPSNPMMCHLYGGALYTELRSDSRNIICRDGVKVDEVSEEEFLAGIYCRGDDLLLLVQKGQGRGFTLRKNGNIIMQRDWGQVLGNLDDPAYAPGGALYEDCGHYLFTWKEGPGIFTVLGGEQAIQKEYGENVTDVRIHEGEFHFAPFPLTILKWNWSRLWFSGGQAASVGEAFPLFHNYGTFYAVKHFSGEDIQEPLSYSIKSDGPVELYYNNIAGLAAVVNRNENAVDVVTEKGVLHLDGDCEFLRSDCAKICDDGMVLGFRHRGRSFPSLFFRNREWDLKWIRGSVVALTIDISPAN